MSYTFFFSSLSSFCCISPRILLGRSEVALTTRVCWLVSEPSRGDCGKSAHQRTTTASLTLTPALPAPIQTVRAAHSLRETARLDCFPLPELWTPLKRAQMQAELKQPGDPAHGEQSFSLFQMVTIFLLAPCVLASDCILFCCFSS